MPDQATQLRRLVLQTGDPFQHRNDGPPTLVISGGRPGVGATTLAVRLAASLAQEALRVVLIDADMYRADLAAQCSLTAGFGIGDVLAGRKTIHEVLERGPAGIQVLAGTASAEARTSLSERSMQRLFRQIKTLSPHADWLLIDAGNQPSDFAARVWSAADRVALVTTPDAVAVMDSYALIKTLLSRQSTRPPLGLIVNESTGHHEAADVHRRIDQSCRRFLGLTLSYDGHVPSDLSLTHAGVMPASPQHAESPFCQAIAQLCDQLFGHNHEPGQRRMAA